MYLQDQFPCIYRPVPLYLQVSSYVSARPVPVYLQTSPFVSTSQFLCICKTSSCVSTDQSLCIYKSVPMYLQDQFLCIYRPVPLYLQVNSFVFKAQVPYTSSYVTHILIPLYLQVNSFVPTVSLRERRESQHIKVFNNCFASNMVFVHWQLGPILSALLAMMWVRKLTAFKPWSFGACNYSSLSPNKDASHT